MAVNLKHVKVTVATAGNPVQLSTSSLKRPAFTVIAAPGNIGSVYVGDATVNASAGNGIPLAPNEHVELEPPAFDGTSEEVEASTLYVDSNVNGDSITLVYFERVK